MRAAAAGLLVDSGILLFARRTAFSPSRPLLAAAPAALAAGAIVWALLQRADWPLVALRADRRLNLKERLTTALELQRQPSSELAGLQLDDAMWHLRRVDARRAFAPRLPLWESRGLALVILALLTLALLPNAGKQALQDQARSTAVIKQEAQKLEKTSAAVQASAAQTNNSSPQERTIESTLTDLQRQLTAPKTTPEQALASLQTAQQKLQANQDQDPTGEAEALQAIAAAFDNQPLLQKAAQDLRAGNTAAAASDLQAASQQASDSGQQAALAAALRAAAAQARAADSQLGDALNQAADAQDGNGSDPASAMSQAAGALQRAGQHAQTQQNVQQALSQVQQSSNNIAQASGASPSASASPADGSLDGSTAAGANGANGASAQASAAMDGSSAQGQASDGANGSSAPGQGQGQGQPGQSPGGQADGGSGGQGSETVFSGQPGAPQGVPGQQGANGAIATSSDNSLADPGQNDAEVPYQQVVGQYQQQASEAMDRGQVPLSYREVVKDYFSSLGSSSGQQPPASPTGS